MVAAAKHGGRASLFSSDGIGAVSTYIVECADFIILAADQEDRETSNVKRLIRTSLAKLGDMGKI
jgi:hypothetical protein